jgi:tRNA threonylcarbamoyladenosine dehydratase
LTTPAGEWDRVSQDYDEMTQRNIGLLVPEEQERLRSLVVAVAGCGGVGGAAAHFLARLGVGELRLADPETFEPSNVNRQFAAYADTLGANKAEAVADELRRINPALAVTVWTEGVGAEMIGPFLDGAGAVVDALDFWSLEVELLLHREAARRGLWIFTSQGAVEISSVTSFDPASGALAGMVNDAEGASMAAAVVSFMPVLPRAATPELLARAISGEHPDVPIDMVASSFEATFLVNELVRVAVRQLPAHAVAPDLMVFDQDELTLRHWDAARRTWRPQRRRAAQPDATSSR